MRSRNSTALVATLLASFLATASAFAQPDGSVRTAGGRKIVSERKAVRTLTGCLRCHGMPDPRVAGDALWISRIATTRCVNPPAPETTALREALQRYVTKRDTLRPTLVNAKSPNGGPVAVESNIEHGSVLLEPFDPARETRGHGQNRVEATIDRSPRAQPRSFRIAWNGPEERARSIPPGRYRIRLYRLLRRDESGKLWQIWGAGDEGQRLTATAGKPLRIEITHRVKIVPCAAKKIDPIRLAGLAHGDNGMGVTIMNGNVRTRARYRLLGPNGAEVAQGTLEYG